MRKRALLGSLAMNVAAGILLFLVGAVTGHLTRPKQTATHITFPLHPLRTPTMKGSVGKSSHWRPIPRALS